MYGKSACTSIEQEQPSIRKWERIRALHKKGNINGFHVSRKVTDPIANERNAK